MLTAAALLFTFLCGGFVFVGILVAVNNPHSSSGKGIAGLLLIVAALFGGLAFIAAVEHWSNPVSVGPTGGGDAP